MMLTIWENRDKKGYYISNLHKEFKKIRDTVTGGSVLASGAQPPESVANFFRWVRVEPCDSICFDIQPIFDYTEPCNSICYNIETCDIIYYHIEPCLLILEFGGAMRP